MIKVKIQLKKDKKINKQTNNFFDNKLFLLITSEYPPEPGGIGSHAYGLSSYMHKNNINVTVLAPKAFKNNQMEFDNKEAFKILRYSGYKFFKILNIIKLFFIEYSKYDNLILISSGLLPFIISGVLVKIFRINSIAIFHGHELSMGNSLLKYISNYVVRNYTKVIAVSDFSEKILGENLDKTKIKVIYNGIDINRFKNFKQKNTKCLNKDLSLLTVGSLSKRKGQHNVIRALPEIKKYFPEVRYNMVGPDNIKKELIDLAQSLGVEDSVKFYGYLEDNELAVLFEKSDLFLMLSENLPDGDIEGFGIAILEANYFGLPAIGSTGCGIENAISNMKTGILVDNKNPIECREAIDFILSNYAVFSQASKDWAKKHDWNQIIKNYINIIESDI